MRRALFLAFTLLACSSKDETTPTGQPDTGTVSDTPLDTAGGRKLDGDPPADLGPDPVPADLPPLMARTKASAGPQMDVPPDLSCQGQPQAGVDMAPIERDFHTIELSGTDADRVPEVAFEIFADNKFPGTPTFKATSSKGADAMDPTRGSVKLKTATGTHAWHVLPKPGYFEVVVLDYSIDKEQLIVPVTAAPEAKVAVIETLVGGSGYTHTKGHSRYVVTVRDCKDLDMMGVHLSLEIDGKTAEIKEGGVRRSYFGDNRLPSTMKWTSRQGVVAFVGVPSTSKLRLVARARLTAGGPIEVIAMRPLPVLPDGIITGIVAPQVEPF